MTFANAVVGADQPLLQVADGAIRQRHDGGNAAAQGDPDRLRAGDVPDVGGLHPLKALQAVAVDRRPGRNVLFDEREHRGLLEVRDDGRL